MLEGLDRVNWRQLRHSYGVATDVPDMLRAMAAVEFEITDFTRIPEGAEGVEKIYYDFGNSVNHQGDISSATAASVPFLVELATNPLVKNRYRILSELRSFVSACNVHVQWRGDLADLRDDIDTYRAIRDHYPAYLKLLDNPDWRIRFHAAVLLAEIRTLPSHARVRLWKRAETESNPNVKAHMFYAALANVQQDSRPAHQALLHKYQVVCSEISRDHTEAVVRWATAVQWVRLWRLEFGLKPNTESLPYIVDALISLELENRSWMQSPEKRKRQMQLKFSAITFSGLEPLTKLGANGMIIALGDRRLNHRLAHEIGRELLDQEFFRPGKYMNDRSFYEKWSHYQTCEMPYHYCVSARPNRTYTTDKPLLPDQKAALEAIVACDAFWEQPTNVFSFFYGLPDDREALRLLVAG